MNTITNTITKRGRPVLQLVAALGLAASMSPAGAVPVVTWDASVSALWNEVETVFEPGAGSAFTSYSPTLLSWGSGNSGPSSLQISPAAADQPLIIPGINTIGVGGTMFGDPGTIATSFSVTHSNNPIFTNTGSLTSTRVDVVTTLTPIDPGGGGVLPPIELLVPIVFDETPNAGPCAGGTTDPCADIFVIGTTAFDLPFIYDGVDYFLSAFPLSAGTFSTLLNEECTSAGAAPGCIGFTTAENAATTADFGFIISTRPIFDVPEPGVLALLGGGLLLVVGYRRRHG